MAQHKSFGSLFFACTLIFFFSASAIQADSSNNQGLVALWNFDGNCQDHSGKVNDNLIPAAGNPQRYVTADQIPATSGKAIALGVDPSDVQYLTATMSADLKLKADYTIEMWIHPTQVSDWNRIALNWGSAPKYAYHVALHNGSVSLYHGQSNNVFTFAEGGQVTPNRWHHIAVVAEKNKVEPEKSQLIIFLNGQKVAHAPFDGTYAQFEGEDLGVGDSAGIPAQSSRYRGYLDDLAIWNKPLGENEIKKHYDQRAQEIEKLEKSRLKELAVKRKKQLADLGFDSLPEIIFAQRHPGRDPSSHYYANFGYACTDENEWLHGADGAKLCKLDPNSGKLTILLDDPNGGIRDPQVSSDAKRILFSYRKAGTHYYNLYEINADGSNLRQITSGNWDDIEPCYLPDGGIAFCSSRCKRYVLCWLAPVAILFRCNPDGSDIQMLSSGAVTENTPCILPDGRILYTRWEYVNRDAVSFHHLWTMNPDGTDQQVYYGNQTPGQVFIDAQPIPNTRSVVFIDSGYHGSHEHAGKVMLVSESSGPNSTEQLKCISPNGQMNFRDPFPVSNNAFLVAQNNSIQLLCDSGKTIPLYTAQQMIHEPRLLKPHKTARDIPSRVDMSSDSASLYLADVYHGRNMAGVKKGSIKKLLILEQLSKPVNYHGGGTTPIAHGGSWTLKRILGTVPVAPDGSAYFQVPPDRSIYIALLDENDRSVKQMRSFVTLRPGEQRGCIGCHESRTQPPTMQQRPASMRKAPDKTQPIQGIPEIFDFPRDIQPILERHCVSCHKPEKRQGAIVLTGNRGPTYSMAYYNLMLHQQITDGAGLHWKDQKNVAGRPVGNDDPYTMHSYAAPLMNKIQPSHHNVTMTEHEKKMIRLWIDTSTQYAGTYAAYGTGQIGAWWRNNEPIREMADNWPTTKPSTDAVNRRCSPCHGRMLPRFVTDQVPVDAFGDLEGWQRPTSRFSRHTTFDLTQPQKSLILMTPLAHDAGGYAQRTQTSVKLIKENRTIPPKPISHPVIFKSTDDPDYRSILAHINAAKERLNEIKRFDMPGFKPRPEYVREMKRYGVLPDSFNLENDPINVYKTDQAYYKLFWHKPTPNEETKDDSILLTIKKRD